MQAETPPPSFQKIVIRVGTQSICGYLESPAWSSFEDVLANSTAGTQVLRIRLHASELVKEFQIAELKAVFFVNSFKGNSARRHINFHSRAPVAAGVWIRVEFKDGEVMEGIVQNSLRYLVEPGFSLVPTDPESNNRLVYVFKSALVDYRVLGLRPA